ncbi:PucR-like helix-turn-helix protein [Stackebrandtia endophytica]|uniref:PucR-like helix-turn-helix protein n=1 Tax=Stackebrandtia endophytica TaxID=1496996 RepID=A0A543ATL3_9ACTN|nr:PucR family transcriptional regulator [Stackebrandtia endophytica]TQL75912.1 PucR-like helix-turn-helix protein [Stackebrandtia endophytica]
MPGEANRAGRPFMLGGRPLHTVIREQVTPLAKTLTQLIATEVDTYRRMDESDLNRDIVALVEHNLFMLANTFERGKAPEADELAVLRAAAGRGAHENHPLEDILAAYHLGARHATAQIFADADPEDYGDIVAAHKLLLDSNQVISAVVCAGYSTARESMRSQEQDARHTVVSALLDGARPMQAGAFAGVRLASRYLVLTVTIDPNPEELTDDPAGVRAGRSKLDRIRQVLDGRTPEPVLTVLDPAGGLLLVPTSESPAEWDDAAKLINLMTDVAGAPIWAAGELTEIAEVAQAARLTQEVLEVVRAFGRLPGLYRLSDVLLEYQLTRPSKAVTQLASLLDPLEDNPDLLHTLQVYLANSLDRRRTAALLHVHPNTVDYRLRRAVQLTGLDPLDPSHLQRIGAAITARRTKPR